MYMTHKLLDVRKITKSRNQHKVVGYKVTLPNEWVERHNLGNGGRVVFLEDGDKNLILQPINT
jgi:hypothetical protein